VVWIHTVCLGVKGAVDILSYATFNWEEHILSNPLQLLSQSAGLIHTNASPRFCANGLDHGYYCRFVPWNSGLLFVSHIIDRCSYNSLLYYRIQSKDHSKGLHLSPRNTVIYRFHLSSLWSSHGQLCGHISGDNWVYEFNSFYDVGRGFVSGAHAFTFGTAL
jgi:hypothetical protein